MTSAFWDDYAKGYDALCVLIPYEELQHAMLAAAAPKQGERLLVAGCGTGNFEALAIQQYPDLHIDAVDFSPDMLQRARAKCAGYAQIRYQQADLCTTIPLPDAGIDLAVMCIVFYALPDQRAALREIFRVLRPGGRLILCDRQPRSALSPIMQAHLRALRTLPPGARAIRWRQTMSALFRLAGVAAKNLLVINKRHRQGAYRYLSIEEATTLLTSVGFTVRALPPVYAEQCWMLHATRPIAEEVPLS